MALKICAYVDPGTFEFLVTIVLRVEERHGIGWFDGIEILRLCESLLDLSPMIGVARDGLCKGVCLVACGRQSARVGYIYIYNMCVGVCLYIHIHAHAYVHIGLALIPKFMLDGSAKMAKEQDWVYTAPIRDFPLPHAKIPIVVGKKKLGETSPRSFEILLMINCHPQGGLKQIIGKLNNLKRSRPLNTSMV